MSDILIKNMEMPSCCCECRISTNDPDCYVEWCAYLEEEITDGSKKLEGCPLVELPPHGRLGDLDKMYSETLKSFSVWPEHCADDFACFIKDAPTVIEASDK